MDWIDFKTVDWKDDNYKSYHIDTRDFHCSMSTNQEQLEDYDILKKYKNKFFYTEDEVVSELNRFFTESGGVGQWRMLDLESSDNRVLGWNLKYIRIYKTDLGFIVCNSKNRAIPKDILSSSVSQEFLNHH